MGMIQPQHLKNWLESYNSHEIAGYPGENCDCPLTRLFRARLYPQARVANGRLYPVPGAPSEPLPAWAARFEAGLLATGRERVTARAALRVLRQVVGASARRDGT